jgi:hypothetical protein
MIKVPKSPLLGLKDQHFLSGWLELQGNYVVQYNENRPDCHFGVTPSVPNRFLFSKITITVQTGIQQKSLSPMQSGKRITLMR